MSSSSHTASGLHAHSDCREGAQRNAAVLSDQGGSTITLCRGDVLGKKARVHQVKLTARTLGSKSLRLILQQLEFFAGDQELGKTAVQADKKLLTGVDGCGVHSLYVRKAGG
jgi:hypothetical protein